MRAVNHIGIEKKSKFRRRASFTGTKFGGGGKKLESESEGGQKFLPPNPLPFCPPERLVFKIRNSGFAQKMFELRPRNTAEIFNERSDYKNPSALAQSRCRRDF